MYAIIEITLDAMESYLMIMINSINYLKLLKIKRSISARSVLKTLFLFKNYLMMNFSSPLLRTKTTTKTSICVPVLLLALKDYLRISAVIMRMIQ